MIPHDQYQLKPRPNNNHQTKDTWGVVNPRQLFLKPVTPTSGNRGYTSSQQVKVIVLTLSQELKLVNSNF